jgi:hypothetical protein
MDCCSKVCWVYQAVTEHVQHITAAYKATLGNHGPHHVPTLTCDVRFARHVA